MNIHFIAIGGSAMHNLALALHEKNKITGSDDIIFEPSKSRLEEKGLLPKKLGWFPEKITKNLDAVILGMHAKPENIELLKAKKLNLKIYSYPEFLYKQSKNKTRVVIAGSHGKTTITSMILHALKYHEENVDYMVGAHLKGFENMLNLTKENEFIILEGDEYLSSATDMTPKFHLYKPNIALISGIAWDHINVFPTFENYKKQFRVFTNSLTKGGIIVYNEEDMEVKKIVEESTHTFKKYPYKTPNYKIKKGITYLETSDGFMPLEIFGKHNLQNLAGAKLICQCIGLGEDEFYEAITSFYGASSRLEKIVETSSTIVFKDFAHSPSKVKATTNAVKNQYKNKAVLACLELHTNSSLNIKFLQEYRNTLDKADKAIVFYSPNNLKTKQLEKISANQIKESFKKEDIIVYTSLEDLKNYLFSQNFSNTVLLFMSSGNYGGLNFEELKKLISID